MVPRVTIGIIVLGAVLLLGGLRTAAETIAGSIRAQTTGAVEKSASVSEKKPPKEETEIVFRGHKEIDFGEVRPEEQASQIFYLGVRSTISYRELFTWTDFRQEGKVVPSERLAVFVGNNETSEAVSNGGTHPAPPKDPHPPTNRVNWHEIDLLLKLAWPDPAGLYEGFLTVEVLTL